MKKRVNHDEIMGKKFGRLTVVALDRYDEQKRRYYYNCICDCGNKCVVDRNNLLRGLSRSCGCLQKEVSIANGKKRKKEVREICSYCGKKVVYAKHLCRNCYQRMRTKGTPEYYISKSKTTKERKEQNIIKRLEWLNNLNPTTEMGKLLVQRILDGATIVELSREFGFSRQTIYDKIKK